MGENLKFSNYDVYVNDKSLLAKDITRLEELNTKTPTNASTQLLSKMKEVQKNIGILQKPQSLSLMIEKVEEYGWKNLERMMKEAITVCEAPNFSKSDCIASVEDIQLFSFNSNLDEEHKLSVDTELEFYKEQQKVLSKFQPDSIDEFNHNVKSINDKYAESTPVTLIGKSFTKKIVPQTTAFVEKVSPVLSHGAESVGKMAAEAWWIGPVLILVALVTIYIEKRRRFSFRKNFYEKLFSLRKNGGLKVRVFGQVKDETLRKFLKATERIQQMFSKKKTFFGEVRFHFYENKKIVKLESEYISESPLQLFYTETSGEVSTAMKLLIAEIEEAGGEALFTTKFSGDGSIEGSSLSLYLPR